MANLSETRRGLGKTNENPSGASDPSAVSTGANSDNASTTAPATKRKQQRAPQKRVLHIFYKAGAPDASGQPTLEIVKVLGDARKVIEFMDDPKYAEQGLRRYKYEVISEPRNADGTDTEEAGEE